MSRPSRSSLSASTPDSLSDNESSLGRGYTPRKSTAGVRWVEKRSNGFRELFLGHVLTVELAQWLFLIFNHFARLPADSRQEDPEATRSQILDRWAPPAHDTVQTYLLTATVSWQTLLSSELFNEKSHLASGCSTDDGTQTRIPTRRVTTSTPSRPSRLSVGSATKTNGSTRTPSGSASPAPTR